MYSEDQAPNSFFLMTACDPVYLRKHAPEWVASAAKSNNNIHLHVVNASAKDIEYINELRALAYGIVKTNGYNDSDWRMTFSHLDIDHVTFDQLDEEAKRTYYACSRFLIAKKLLWRDPSCRILITDTDCLIMDHINTPSPDIDLGLFLREPLPGVNDWEREGSRVAAGVLYLGRRGLEFITAVEKYLTGQHLRWFLDQYAISQAWKEVLAREQAGSFLFYDNTFMDWEFKEGTTIWTGKGPRKYENQTYLAKKAEFRAML